MGKRARLIRVSAQNENNGQANAKFYGEKKPFPSSDDECANNTMWMIKLDRVLGGRQK